MLWPVFQNPLDSTWILLAQNYDVKRKGLNQYTVYSIVSNSHVLFSLPRSFPAFAFIVQIPGNGTFRFQEMEHANPGKRVRAVDMCFYGSGQDLDKSKWYKLVRNPTKVKDVILSKIAVKFKRQ